MMTSEASYLNSLNVLTDHFISNFNYGNLLSYEESSILFGKIPAGNVIFYVTINIHIYLYSF